MGLDLRPPVLLPQGVKPKIGESFVLSASGFRLVVLLALPAFLAVGITAEKNQNHPSLTYPSLTRLCFFLPKH